MRVMTDMDIPDKKFLVNELEKWLLPQVKEEEKHPIIAEKPFTLPKELFELVDFTEMGVVNEASKFKPKFVRGEKYALSGVSCDGFKMQEKVYELVGVHDKFDNIDINSIIVKQIGGNKDKIFTLSKNDCKHIGIKYENGLQLFPKQLNWRRIKDILPFNSANLATMPLSDIDNTIRYALVKIYGFKDYKDGYVLTPSGKLIKEKQFEKTLRISSSEPLVYGNGVVTREHTNLNVEIVYPKGIVYKYNNFISSEDTIYVLIKFARQAPLNDTTDGLSGIERPYVDGFNPNDHLEITWDEKGAMSIEEYEEAQKKIENERLAKIAKEEARKNEIKRSFKTYDIKYATPTKIQIPKASNSISSFNFYADEMERNLSSLEYMLSNIENELNKLFE